MSQCRRVACGPSCIVQGPTVGRLRATGRLVALLAAVLVGAIFIAGCASWPGHHRSRRASWALQRVSRWALRALGVRLDIHGAPRSGPSLVVGNHVSWLDILALTASAPMRMVAKAEVAAWPVIGWCARRTGTLFLQRERLRDLPEVVAEMTSALRSGSRVQVFPEATTRCGGALDPFRRAAFQAAIDAGVVVSPVTVQYLDVAGRPCTAPAFVGVETLAGAVRRMLLSPPVTVQIHWLRPIPALAGTGRASADRTTVARLAERSVALNLGLPVLRRRPAVPRVALLSAERINAGRVGSDRR